MMLLLLTFADVKEWFFTLLYGFVLNLATLVYEIVNVVYQVFYAVATARIFPDEFYRTLANRAYVVIAIATMFFLAYALLRAIINPDGGGKNEMAPNKIIISVLTTIVLLAFTPTIFRFVFQMQGVVLRQNVIGTIINGTKTTTTSGDEFKDAGRNFANQTFIVFFRPPTSEEHVEDYTENGEGNKVTCDFSDVNWQSNCLGNVTTTTKVDGEEVEINLASTYESVGSNGIFYQYRPYASEVAKGNIKYNWIMQIGVGIFMIYLFVSLSIDMGLRAVKLAYYQVIAPIPILTRIIPGQKKIFDNWLKGVTSTFLEVFIILAAISLGLLLITQASNILTSFADIWGNEPPFAIKAFAYVFIIIGILLFIKQAPKLVFDMFGLKPGSFKLGIADKLKEAPIAGRVAGAVTGAVGAGWSAALNGREGFFQGIKYGASQGWKQGGNQFDSQRKNIYNKTYGLKGTPSLLHKGQVLPERWSDNVKKATERGYKDNLKSYLDMREKRDNFKVKYNATYAELLDQHKKNRNAYQVEYDKVQKYYDDEELRIVTNRDNALARYDSAQTELSKVLKQQAKERQTFELNKQKQMSDIESKIDAPGTSHDDIVRLSNKLRQIENTRYSNPELEQKIASFRSVKAPDLDQYDNMLHENRYRMENDAELDKYKELIAKEDKIINDPNELANEVKPIAQSRFAEEHPTYKNYLDRYNELETKAKVGKYINTEQGQIDIAIREAAERRVGGGAPPSGAPKGDSGAKKG